MPSPEALERFIARVEANAHAEAIAELTPDGRRIARIVGFFGPLPRQGGPTAHRTATGARAPGTAG